MEDSTRELEANIWAKFHCHFFGWGWGKEEGKKEKMPRRETQLLTHWLQQGAEWWMAVLCWTGTWQEYIVLTCGPLLFWDFNESWSFQFTCKSQLFTLCTRLTFLFPAFVELLLTEEFMTQPSWQHAGNRRDLVCLSLHSQQHLIFTQEIFIILENVPPVPFAAPCPRSQRIKLCCTY